MSGLTNTVYFSLHSSIAQEIEKYVGVGKHESGFYVKHTIDKSTDDLHIERDETAVSITTQIFESGYPGGMSKYTINVYLSIVSLDEIACDVMTNEIFDKFELFDVKIYNLVNKELVESGTRKMHGFNRQMISISNDGIYHKQISFQVIAFARVNRHYVFMQSLNQNSSALE